MLYKHCPFDGFEPGSSGIGSDRSTNFATLEPEDDKQMARALSYVCKESLFKENTICSFGNMAIFVFAKISEKHLQKCISVHEKTLSLD